MEISRVNFINLLDLTRSSLPWIPEPSTVNNKLKRREGSGIQGNPTYEITKFIKGQHSVLCMI
jgi:hypothetical protein